MTRQRPIVKKRPAPMKSLVVAVTARADRILQRGKMARLLPSTEMPQIEVIKLDGTRETGDRMVQYAMMQANGAFAWMKVVSTLGNLVDDAVVSGHPAAKEFAEVIFELARRSVLADSAGDALIPVGMNFVKGGRQPGAVGDVRREVRRILKRAPNATAAKVWAAIKGAPPKNFSVCENRLGKYIEVKSAGSIKTTSYARFANIVSAEKNTK